MNTKWFTYKIKIASNLSLVKVKDMLRYSGDKIIDKISEHEFILLHRMNYEDDEHLQRRMKFFKGIVLGRWGSFACEVSELTEIEKP